MPIPKPKQNEPKDDFISRCMANDTMKKEYEDNDQRLAVCHSVWNDKTDNVLQHLTANISGLVRHERMEDRPYLVVPMVMGVVGVWNGSNGPLLYPEQEMAKTPNVWNHKPVVVYHPQINGKGVSACDPDILTAHKVGVIMNTRFEDGKWKAEAWLEENRIEAVDNRVAEALENNTVMEVSTGLYVDEEPTEGEYDGIEYRAIAHNFRPDHLALLPDKIGACSVEMGAGFLRNERQPDINEETQNKVKTVLADKLNRAKELAGLLSHNDCTDETVHEFLGMLAEDVEANQTMANSFGAFLTGNALSHQALREALEAEVSKELDPGSAGQLVFWVVDVFDDTFVYEKNDRLYRMGYSVDDNTVSISGVPEEVMRRYEYIAANENFTERYVAKGSKMDKEQVIAELIEAGTWNEDDREFLLNQDEDSLAYFQKKAEEFKQNQDDDDDDSNDSDNGADEETNDEAPAENEEPITVESYIANAPKEIQEVLTNGVREHKRVRKDLIESILANERNTLTRDQLRSRSLDDLRAFAAFACNEDEDDGRRLNYSGKAPVAHDHKEEPLDVPTMNFKRDDDE